jgi:anti-anti-sigma regulatory factor
MNITQRSVGDVTVLDLEGALVGGPGTVGLKDKVNRLVFQKLPRVVINLGGVAQIDNSGLGELCTCLTTVSKTG